MELEVLGIGDAFTAQHSCTSFLLRVPEPILIDGPPSLFQLLKRRNLHPSQVDSVLLTHTHPDHSSGFLTLLLWRWFFLGRKTRLLTTAAVYEDVRRCLLPQLEQGFTPDLMGICLNQLEDYVDYRQLLEDEPNPLAPGVSVDVRHNWHPCPTLGLRLRSPAFTVGISGDTCYRPALLRELFETGVLNAGRWKQLAGGWLWECDLIYHEVSTQEKGPHTWEGDLLALPAEIRSRIRLVHVADDFQSQGLIIAAEGERVTPGANGGFRIISPGP